MADQVRLGIIGCGGFARNVHVPNILLNNKLCVVAACDLNLQHAEAVQAQTGARYATTEPGRIFADDQVDAVLIATRHDSHAVLSVQAAEAGKHILCEKPMGLNMAECRRVAEAVQRAGVVYTVGYNRGLSPLVVKAKELMAGSLAKKMIYHRIQAPFPESHWTHVPEIGGGRFVGEGCHIFDLFCELVGAPPTSVYAAGGTFLDPERVKIPDSAIVTLTFADGSVATTLIASDGCAEFPKEATEIYWDGKAVYISDFREMSYHGVIADGEGRIALKATDKGHRREIDLFADAILRGTPSPNGLENALRAALISFLVGDSLATGQAMAINAADYRIA
ncbi:MAG: Gfo/Idh/MocA family oxidoreductase [Chloroflexi bacterium]|nr:Gfo/Idh/MocA family oxidoreductase [Chloroflexota bacterium]